jgi:hypothetical protein
MDPNLAQSRFATAGSPPGEALDAVATAARCAQQLAATGLELHFELDEVTRRMAAYMRDVDGRNIRPISLLEALDLLSDATG